MRYGDGPSRRRGPGLDRVEIDGLRPPPRQTKIDQYEAQDTQTITRYQCILSFVFRSESAIESKMYIDRAGRWILSSGITADTGGVARYYRSDLKRNAAVSTEISGYAVSALAFLHETTGDPEYLQMAMRVGNFLVDCAWDRQIGAMPFEFSSDKVVIEPRSYFFDCGIIVRGLLAVWRVTGNAEFLKTAVDCGGSMLRDFDSGTDFHPILKIPSKEPVARDGRWSRSPGCYQLKAALGWRELAIAAGDGRFETAYQRVLADSLRTAKDFLRGDLEPDRVMDRLHAFCYFLEGLTPNLQDEGCAAAFRNGLEQVAFHLHHAGEGLLRSDVIAQVLRLRLFGAAGGFATIDEFAEFEAESLALFQAEDADGRLDGGFYFGLRSGEMLPYVNPVSTVFGMHALYMWARYRDGTLQVRPEMLF